MKSSNRIITAVLLVLILSGIIIRFVNLDADAPLYFAGSQQSLTTDAPQYTYFARNSLLFEHPDKFDNDRWRSFEVSLVNGLGYVLFAAFGISRFNADLVGLILQFLSITIFLLAFRKAFGLNSLLLIAVILLANKVLFVYGRQPYLENGMIFFIATVCYLFMNFRHKLPGQVLIGVLIGLAATAGKIFGLIMIVPVAVTILMEDKSGKYRAVVVTTVSMLAAIAVWVVIFYGGGIGEVFGYYTGQTAGLYGFPEALKSPVTFIERLFSFGNDNRFFYHAPVLGLFTFLALMTLIPKSNRATLRTRPELTFMLVWLVAGVLIFMLGNYRPLRYIYFLYFPMALIVVFALNRLDNIKPNEFSKLKTLLQFIILAFFLEQAAFILFSGGQYDALHRQIVWITIPIALAISIADYKYKVIQRIDIFKSNRYWTAVLVLLLILNFGYSYYDWNRQTAFNLKEAGNDLGEILGENAVICGPPAPAMLYENDLRGMIYAAGLSDKDPDYFKNYPVTHFIIDAEASSQVIENYPQLASAAEVTSYWIRDDKIIVVRIAGLTGNAEADRYYPSDFEIGRFWMQSGVYDSALYYIESFYLKHPTNKSAIALLGDLYPIAGRVDDAEAILKKRVELYPDDFTSYMALGTFYRRKYAATGDRSLIGLADEAFSKMAVKNPYRAGEAVEIIKKFSGR